MSDEHCSKGLTGFKYNYVPVGYYKIKNRRKQVFNNVRCSLTYFLRKIQKEPIVGFLKENNFDICISSTVCPDEGKNV